MKVALVPVPSVASCVDLTCLMLCDQFAGEFWQARIVCGPSLWEMHTSWKSFIGGCNWATANPSSGMLPVLCLSWIFRMVFIPYDAEWVTLANLFSQSIGISQPLISDSSGRPWYNAGERVGESENSETVFDDSNATVTPLQRPPHVCLQGRLECCFYFSLHSGYTMFLPSLFKVDSYSYLCS